MAKWAIEEKPRKGNSLIFELLRDGKWAGRMSGAFDEAPSGLKYFIATDFVIYSPFQEEYMKAHEGVKMGEALGWVLLKTLKKEGVSYIQPYAPLRPGERFIDRAISTGILEKTPEGFWKINWEIVPATEEALKELAGEMRANEAKAKADARAAKRKRIREWAKRLFRRTRPK